MIEQGTLTEDVIAFFVSEGLEVGDNLAPANGGWVKGQPNVNAFVPYVVVMTGDVRPKQGAAGCSYEEWDAFFSIRYFGGSREQLSKVTQTGRNLLAFKRWITGVDDRFDVIQTHFVSLGAVTRVDTVDPPMWQVYDSIRFELDRSRNQP